MIFRAGLLPAETIENALEEGVKTGRRLGEILIERGLIKEEDLTRLLAGQKGLPFVSVRDRTVDPEAAQLLAEDQARLFNALPIAFEDGVPVVALADPTNEVLNRNIREALGQEARFVVAARSELNDVITEVFNGAIDAPARLTVDTSVPPTELEAAPEPAAVEPERVVPAEPEPAPEADLGSEAEPEPALQFDASAYDPEPMQEAVAESQPEPVPEPESVFEPEPEPEPDPVPVPTAFEAPVAPEPTTAPSYEPEAAEPAPPAPLATEPVAPQTPQQSNGEVPHFEDDSPPPAAPSGGGFRVSIRLTTGERMTVAECSELGEAKGYAKALTKQLGAADSEDWPFVNGRFLKPETIVSVDIEEL